MFTRDGVIVPLTSEVLQCLINSRYVDEVQSKYVCLVQRVKKTHIFHSTEDIGKVTKDTSVDISMSALNSEVVDRASRYDPSPV